MSSEKSLASTFSIVACDPEAEEWGVAVESKFFGVGAVVPWARAGVGAIATQAFVNVSYGSRGLRLLRRGLSASEVVKHLTAHDPLHEQRQVGVVDAQGRTASYTGKQCQPWAGGLSQKNFSVQGNILASERVIKDMAHGFRNTRGKLAGRLIAALEAGQAAGGDRRGQQSSAILVVRSRSDRDGIGDRYVDLRVDDHTTPIAELHRLYEIWERFVYPLTESTLVKQLRRTGNRIRAENVQHEVVNAGLRLARLNPQDAELRNTFAWFLAPLGSLEEAFQLAKQAVKLSPDNPDFLDTLAEVHFKRGEFRQAVEIERPLIKKNPEREDLKTQLEKFERAWRRASMKS